MMRNALIATAVVALALAAVWVWSAHPGCRDLRPILHHAEWAEIKGKAVGGGFPFDPSRAKARILLVEPNVLWRDWEAQPSGDMACWKLKGSARLWRVCRGQDGRTRSISVTWLPAWADSATMPREPVLRRLIGDLAWVASPSTGAGMIEQLTRRANGRLDFGPPVLIGAARVRGERSIDHDLSLEAIPAEAPVPDDWTYVPSQPGEYLGPPWPSPGRR